MNVMAIDPGTNETAYVMLSGKDVMGKGIIPNHEVLPIISTCPYPIAIEMIASYGMPVGREVFETCVWIGRFVEVASGEATLIYRKDVKMHLCGTPRAKDGNIRQELLDRYGPGKAAAIGLKKTPGPLYGFKSHLWAALAVGVYYQDVVAPMNGGLDDV